DIHGIGVRVAAQETAVLEAMELRFRDFRREASATAPSAQISFEFVTGGERPALPGGSDRPVYDTPYGSLYYFPDEDAVYGELAGVRLRCQVADGVAAVHSDAF